MTGNELAPVSLDTSRSPIVLSDDSRLTRKPRWSLRARPRAFLEAFESKLLAYDVFWSSEGDRILMVGPPLLNLGNAVRSAIFRALPSGKRILPRCHTSLSTTITELVGAPPDTKSVDVAIGDSQFEVEVQPNFSASLSGARILFSINKNNELDWIDEWARWHVLNHGTDTVVLFDNGSDRYTTEDIAVRLSRVPGIASYAVIAMPHRFGQVDPAVISNPYWPLFLQISTMSIVLRRFGMAAAGLINCDIDELANPPDGQSLYDVCQASKSGLVILRGRWIEAVRSAGAPDEVRHRHFPFKLVDDNRPSSPAKWVLDPKRDWVKNLSVHPYWHWVHGRPPFSKTRLEEAFYWHFRGINTGWKDTSRPVSTTERGGLVHDARLKELMAAFTALSRIDGC